MTRAVFAFCVVLAWSAQADQTSFDCVWRAEVLRFAKYIQPGLNATDLQRMADALNGADNVAPGCHVSPPEEDGLSEPSTTRAPTAEMLGDGVIYADARHGSDSNSGSSSSPVATISRGVELTRSTGAKQLMLRNGFYTVSSAIALGPQDSGLAIVGEAGAIVSAASPLEVSWETHNVGPSPVYPSGQRQWLYRADSSAVGGNPTAGGPIVAAGKTKDWQTCQSKCQASATCNVWTWLGRDGSTCWFRTDGSWEPTQYYSSYAGYLTPPSPELPAANIWKADVSHIVGVSSEALPPTVTVRLGERRAIRGRFPNADPETQGFDSALNALSWLKPTTPVNPDIEFNPASPFRNNSGQFSLYQLGIGGPCEHFNPPAGYWCGNHTSGGGAFTYRVPSGMVVDDTVLPHLPNYSDPTGAIIQTWRPGHWSSWAFQVGSFDASSGTLQFAKGGFQGARGNDDGDNFYIEGVLAEVDTGAEFFFDHNTSTLYLFSNQTGSPPPSAQGGGQGAPPAASITSSDVIFSIVGTKEQPVKGVSIQGLTIRDAGQTLVNETVHGMPSGGDWALARTGAIYATGTEGLTITDNLFTRNDGNDIMLFGYHLDAQVTHNQFEWTGSTCVALWGKTQGAPGGDRAAGMGPDGTAGEQPTNTVVAGNVAREFGVWEKQSSFFFQAKAGSTTIFKNIAYNGPRANINFNDGFRGGNNMTGNILFNSCRESGDHGPFNSWDRQVFQWLGSDGKPTTIKDFDRFQHNMIMGGYSADEAIDNDDGSRRFDTSYNAFYATKSDLKSDFSGNQNYHHDNVLAYIGEGFHAVQALAGLEDQFYNNTLVLAQGGQYGSGQCSASKGDQPVLVGNNTVYTQDGTLSECGMTLEQWQQQGHDLGTTVAQWPEDSSLIDSVRSVLYVL